MADFFTAPFPFRRDAIIEFIVCIAVGAFVVAFLLIFEPFGTDDFENPNRTIFLSGYGIIVTVVFLIARFIFPLLCPSWFIEESWNIARHLLWVIAAFSLALGCCFLYWGWFFGNALTWTAWWGFAAFGLAIGIFPIIASIAADYIMLLRKHQRAASRIHLRTESTGDPGQCMRLTGQNAEESLSLLPEQLLYLHAAGNYVEIFYRSGQEIKKALFRTTLSALEQELGICPVARCHRSYLVNLEKVIQVSGNAQGYRLHLLGVAQPIPVSRQQSTNILAGINSLADAH